MASSNEAHVEESETGKEIQESVDRAQLALNRVDNVAKRQAQHGNNPKQTREYWDALMDCDMAVHDAYSRLRKYILEDQPDYWNKYIVGYQDGALIVLGGYDGEEIETEDLEFQGQLRARLDEGAIEDARLEYFEDWQGAVESYTTTQRERFGDQRRVTKHIPKVLTPDDYRRVVRLLDTIRRKLGFTPTPTESTPRTEITREMIDDVEEWRQENLPEDYL